MSRSRESLLIDRPLWWTQGSVALGRLRHKIAEGTRAMPRADAVLGGAPEREAGGPQTGTAAVPTGPHGRRRSEGCAS